MELADTGQRVIQKVFTDTLQFMNSIHGNFLDIVDPIDSLLLDELFQNGAIDSDKNEQIINKSTRRDKARETWILLNQLPPKRFWESCYPVLRDKYPHVLEEKELRWDEKLNDEEEEQCIRHAIMTMMELKRFGDLFPPGGDCSLDKYRAFGKSGDTNQSWEPAFKLCERRIYWDNPEFILKLEDLLQSIEVDVPVNFREVVAGGFHCTCSPKRSTPMVRRRKKRKKPAGTKPCDEVSSDGYPASTQEDPCEDGCSVSIGSSSESSWDTMPEECDEQGDIQFDTPETEEKFFKEMEKIKQAIKKCSNMRTLYHEAVCIDGGLLILCAIVKQRGRVENASADDKKINKLRREVKKIAGIMKKDYDTVKKIKEEAECDTELQNLPPFARKIFLEHRQRLICEFNEIMPFPEAVERKLESGSYKFAFANCARENRRFNFTGEHRHATVPAPQNQ
ncbi:uncharacterized protein [Littorina saxatilis]|uniref:Uncharacterized protein n=1 Tax=Littorina saxatilis TaxID=31220 RepID=A0AAN9BDW1_9CAEN